MIITQSETSDEALKRFERSLERLRRLDIASGYAEMLKEVDALRYDHNSFGEEQLLRDTAMNAHHN